MLGARVVMLPIGSSRRERHRRHHLESKFPIFRNSLDASPDSPIDHSPSRPTEGRIRIVRDAGRDAVDAAAFGAQANCRAGLGLSQTRER
jgi:hypothetical protein